jgi:hypothetical protein
MAMHDHTSDYAALIGRTRVCGEYLAYSPRTALRDIQQLVERGIFVKNPGGGRRLCRFV